ncbi:hypothetical protein IFM89_010090 [Coptis chinensis]|uniref:Amino acid transporter transmembrane domain-containing protein n=1 Tax=Coptis chinensis TaxID=261450 RepID=A0A835LV36_9MAGN|nr:hypothetical protein IFM89_010090 [Coptis chinensis]
MSFGYSIISFCLCMAKWISHGDIRGSLMGIMSREDATLSSASKTWSTFQALGNIAFAFTYAEVLIEIQRRSDFWKLLNNSRPQITPHCHRNNRYGSHLAGVSASERMSGKYVVSSLKHNNGEDATWRTLDSYFGVTGGVEEAKFT